MGKEAKFLTVINLDYSNPSKDIVDITYPKYRSSYITRQLDRYQVKDPEKTLEELYNGQPTLLRQIQIYKTERDSLELIINNAKNISEFSNIAMHKSKEYDIAMQERIDNYLISADSMRTAAIYNSPYSE